MADDPDSLPPTLGMTYTQMMHTHPRLKAITDALIEELRRIPSAIAGTGEDAHEQIVGFAMVPIAHRRTETRDQYAYGFMLCTESMESTIHVQAVAAGLLHAHRVWFGYVNERRASVLDAYVREEIEFGEIPKILGETYLETAQALGQRYLPTSRSALGIWLDQIKLQVRGGSS